MKLWHKRKWQEFKGCWRKHSGGALTDLRLCAFCVFHRHPGCEHVCPGYRYGDVSVRVKENNGKKFKVKQERVYW